MADVIMIYSTFPSAQEARRAAEDAVERRLAACANIFPGVTSIYEFNGEFANNTECVVLFKTTRDRERQIIEHIKATHSYEEPALLTIPVVGGDADYLRWVVRHSA